LVHYIFLYKLLTDLKLENLVFKIRFLNTQTEKKYAKAVQKTLSKVSQLNTLEHLLHSSEVWRSIHIAIVAAIKGSHTKLR